MKYLKKGFAFLIEVFTRAGNDMVYAASGHATLFAIISFFPLVMLLLALMKYLPFSPTQVKEVFGSVAPQSLLPSINDAIDEIYARSGSFVLSVTTVTLIWSASTSVYSIILGLNRIYNKKETRNYFVVRSLSILYTFIFIAAVATALVLMVFGKALISVSIKYMPFLADLYFPINLTRIALGFILLTLTFDIIYTVIPNRPSRLLFELPGAIISSLGWYIFSDIYSIYIDNFGNASYVYGSIAAVVLLMVWFYFCMFIFFIGAELNIMFADLGWCRKRREKVRLARVDMEKHTKKHS